MSATTTYHCDRCGDRMPYDAHRRLLTVARPGDEPAADYTADLCTICVNEVQMFIRHNNERGESRR
jgi:hypothetical protein